MTTAPPKSTRKAHPRVPAHENPALEPIRVAIRKLPPYPFTMDGDDLGNGYVVTLQRCATPADLKDLLTKWAPLWSINFAAPGMLDAEEVAIVAGTYDADEVFKALCEIRVWDEVRGAAALDKVLEESFAHRVAMHILMPHAMLEMFEIAQKFSTPMNGVWIQAAGLTELT